MFIYPRIRTDMMMCCDWVVKDVNALCNNYVMRRSLSLSHEEAAQKVIQFRERKKVVQHSNSDDTLAAIAMVAPLTISKSTPTTTPLVVTHGGAAGKSKGASGTPTVTIKDKGKNIIGGNARVAPLPIPTSTTVASSSTTAAMDASATRYEAHAVDHENHLDI
jgi:predicted flavoprotein YhiN